MTSHCATKPDLVETVQASIIGHEAMIETAYGLKPLVYADYGASGRMSALVEDQLAAQAALYANPHNEDSMTGQAATSALHQAYSDIKTSLNAHEDHVLIACANGATAAIAKLQEILGVACPPATRALIEANMKDCLASWLGKSAPVIFIGPYEHHSNELSWRESLAETVTIGLDETGALDLEDLAQQLSDPRFEGRQKIGAFSAASNVTGVKTDIAGLARLLHAHNAVLCLDCAASAPYLQIDLSPSDRDAAPDAVYFSPHKMLGGPGACGILVIDKSLYPAGLAPTISGGGTVRYVTPNSHDFIDDIEARERAGTPGLTQIQRAAAALSLLDQVGWSHIEAIEHDHLEHVFEAWRETDGIQILGPDGPDQRIGLVSFTLRDEASGLALHPRFVARLLNDLYGIQARAGCSCAGPYGHYLLDLDATKTEQYREAVLQGYAGLRPGWVRICLHWTMSAEERDYIIAAVKHICRHATRFLSDYEFDLMSGAWTRRDGKQCQLSSAQRRAKALSTHLREVQELAIARTPGSVEINLPAAHAELAAFAGFASANG